MGSNFSYCVKREWDEDLLEKTIIVDQNPLIQSHHSSNCNLFLC